MIQLHSVTDREKRTLRMAAAGISLYLLVFFGLSGWKHLEAKRSEYQQLVLDAQRLRREIRPYENRVLLAEKLKERFHLDPKKLSRASLVADASAAIQKAAGSGGIQVGPIRESSARSSAKEFGSMQLEGSGPVAAVMTLLNRLETLGFPLILDSVLITPDPSKPGILKINLTILILDFEQWKREEAPNA